MRSKTQPILLAAALALGGLALPSTAEADGWRGRGYGHGWGPPPRVYHHHHPGWRAGEAALGAVLGLGAGVVIGSALAPPPPPPVHYYAPPPPVVIYQQPPVVYAPPPGRWVQAPPYWVPR